MRTFLALMLTMLPLAAFPVPRGLETPSVADTAWKGVVEWDNAGTFDIEITFQADGTFFLTRNGSTLKGKWSQAGADVVFDTNSQSRYELRVRENTLVGTARSTGSVQAAATLTLQRNPGR